MIFKKCTKEDLIKRLKALADDQTEYPMSEGAMCYEPSVCENIKIPCERCKEKFSVSSWDDNDYKEILRLVKKMNAYGVDAKVERICRNCIEKMGIDVSSCYVFSDDGMWDEKTQREHFSMDGIGLLECVFYFKTSEQENYHIAIAPYVDYYNAVLAFLAGEPTYDDRYDQTHLVRDEIRIIEQMTGITPNA